MCNKKALSQKEPQTQYQAAPSTSIFLLPMQWKKILKERNNFLEIPVKSTSPNRSIIILEWNYSFFYYRYIHPVYLHCRITTYFYRLVLLVDGIFTRLCKQEAAIFFSFINKAKNEICPNSTSCKTIIAQPVSTWSSYDPIFKMLNLTWAFANMWYKGEDY